MGISSITVTSISWCGESVRRGNDCASAGNEGWQNDLELEKSSAGLTLLFHFEHLRIWTCLIFFCFGFKVELMQLIKQTWMIFQYLMSFYLNKFRIFIWFTMSLGDSWHVKCARNWKEKIAVWKSPTSNDCLRSVMLCWAITPRVFIGEFIERMQIKVPTNWRMSSFVTVSVGIWNIRTFILCRIAHWTLCLQIFWLPQSIKLK